MVAPDDNEPIIKKSIIQVLEEMDSKQEERFARMEKQNEKQFTEIKCELKKVTETMRSQEIEQALQKAKQDDLEKKIKDIDEKVEEQEDKIRHNSNISKIAAWAGGLIGTIVISWIVYLILNGAIGK